MHVYWHDDALVHDTGAGIFEHPASPLVEVPELHPENAERIRNVRAALRNGPIAEQLEWHAGRHALREELEMLHLPEYIDSVQAFCAAGGGYLTQSTPVVERSWDAALAAAGTALGATAAVLDGECDLAYALVRPPGHHAQPDRADGYCLFSNAALAAELARRRGIERVAVLDWDVHHGNGTQECFWRRGDVLAVSFHMRHGSWGPSHPQTGAPDEVGEGDGAGRNVNVELPVGTGDEGYRRAMARAVGPVVDAFRPGLIVIACGQDASQFDPNGRMCVSMTGSAISAQRPGPWPTATAADGSCSSRRAATDAPTRASACTPPSKACSAPGRFSRTRWRTCRTMSIAPTRRSRPSGQPWRHTGICSDTCYSRSPVSRMRLRRALTPEHAVRPCRSISAPDPGRSCSTSARPLPDGCAWSRRSSTASIWRPART